MKLMIIGCILISFSTYAMNWDIVPDTQILKELHQSGQQIKLGNGVIYFEKGSLSNEDLEKTKKQFEAAIKEVPELLGINWKRERYKDNLPTLYIYHSMTTGPHVYFGYEHYISDRPAIFVPSPIIQADYAPIFHEFTHLITENFWSLSLREGLADFVQFYLRPGQKATMKKTVTDFHSDAREILKEKSSVLKYIGAEGYHYDSVQDRIDFYQLSRSFVTYLIQHYGGSKFLELYGDKNGYESIYSKSLDELKGEWLEATKTSITVQDLSDDPFHEPWMHFYWKKLKDLFSLY